MKPRIVNNARDAWKWSSTRWFLVLAAIPHAWAQIPPDVKNMIPDAWGPAIFSVMAAAGVLLRVSQLKGE
jgi:hypothetical protein